MERFNHAYSPYLEGKRLRYFGYNPLSNCEIGGEGGWGINRQRFSYCPDAYKVTYLYPQGTPVLACKRVPEKPNPLKQDRNCPAAGNPINLASGNKYQRDSDYRGTGAFPLVFERHYNSDATLIATPVNTPVLGERWRHGLERSVRLTDYATLSTATVTRADGRGYFFNLADDGSWLPDPDITGRLDRLFDQQHEPTGWRYTENDEVEIYDAQGKLISLTNPSGLSQTLGYNAAGQLVSVTDPFGRKLTFTYDAAHRLTAIQDSAGNTITYTLDPLGNRIKEEVTDPASALTRIHARVYNSLNRLLKNIGGEGQERSYAYDPNGNRLSAIDGRGHQSTFAFDALKRLLASADAKNGVTEYSYDALDHLTQVKDSKGLETTYTTNALGDLLVIDSPDTGTTRYAYDSAGNRVSQLDAKGVEILYRYDALSRLTATDYVDDTLDVSFTYDEGVNGIGRLTTMRDGSGTTSYQYDLRGNIIEMQTIHDGIMHTLGYAYNEADQVMSITYPSGRTVDYPRNPLGQISGVTTTLNGETQTLASNIGYAPFGPLTGLTFGNGVPMNRQLDLDYRLTANIHQSVLEQGVSFDAADNISAIEDNLDMSRNQSFDHDAVDRLTSAKGVYGAHGYAYDAAGNRVSQLTDTASETYSYATGSQRLESITGTRTDSFSYDANGNTTGADSFTLGYGQNNRLSEMRLSGVVQASYTYNGRGERVKKEALGEVVYFHYDLNGQLLAETDPQGQTLKEYLYLEGIPLAVAAAKATPSGVRSVVNSGLHDY
ncbi:MAG: DUF6531 domain-containing protein [Gammaproteobacteria bacterium]